MTRSRRWLMFPFVAVCAAMLGGVAVSQDDTPKKTPKDTPSAADKEVPALKKQLADTQDKLTTTEKAAAKAAADALKSELSATAKAAADAKKSADDALKAATAPKGPDEVATKAAEEFAKVKAAVFAANGDDKVDGAAKIGQQRGNTAWMLTASAFVMFMVPGLALFYAGMVRRKNVLATMMQSIAALAVVGVYWVAVGYGLAFGPSVLKLSLLGVEQGGIIGWSPDLLFLAGVNTADDLPAYKIPIYAHVMFQGMFAIITPALISGAIAERIRFWPFCIFMVLWITLVYCPLAHMVWAFDWFDASVPIDKRGATAIGLLGKLGALDFAGGTVVHIAAGMAGLACALVLRKRDGYPRSVTHPNSMVLTLLGAGMLWFGWFGFNGGSYLDSSNVGASAFAATQVAAAAAGLVWMVVEWLHRGKPTALGLASGIVAGLVAVTPASGFVYIWGGLAIGAAAAVVCYAAVFLKGVLGYDDSLDAFGVHGVGGFVGAVLTGLFCYNAVNPLVVPGTGGNDGYFAVKGEAFKTALADAEAKLTSEQREQALKAGTDDEKAALSDDQKAFKTLAGVKENGPLAQTIIQLKAAVFSVVYAFVLSLVLCVVVQAITLGNFSTSAKDETVGLDQTEHGESGFDFGYATESVTVATTEPRPASAPRGDGRFGLAVEGATHSELIKVWSALCQPTDTPPDPDFLAVYPTVTTVSGSTFKFKGGSAEATAKRLEALFKKQLPGKPVKVVRV